MTVRSVRSPIASLSRQARTWGSYSYKASEDVLRFDVKPEPASMTEWLTYSVVPLGPDALEIEFRWERLRVAFRVAFDVDGLVRKSLDEALAAAGPTDWEVYVQAARYDLEKGTNLEKALVHASKALQGKETFWTLELKARALDRLGRREEAIPLLVKAIASSRGQAPAAYTEGLEKTLAEWSPPKPSR